jgi:hypothetical protein
MGSAWCKQTHVSADSRVGLAKKYLLDNYRDMDARHQPALPCEEVRLKYSGLTSFRATSHVGVGSAFYVRRHDPRMIARVLSYALLVAVLFLLQSCSQAGAIVGYWQWGDVKSFWEFRADGTCQTHGEVASKVTGRYKFLSREKLRIDITGDAHPKMLLVSIKGDDMIITENKFDMKLHRVDASAIRPRESEILPFAPPKH